MGLTFEDFWKWLQKNNGSFENLGRRGTFEIETAVNDGICKPKSTGKPHPFEKSDAEKTWNRYNALPGKERLMAGRYVDPKWSECPNRLCCPWIAATIRDFYTQNIQCPQTKI